MSDTNHIDTPKPKRFKKRYIAFGILALELASLPAAAKIIEQAWLSGQSRLSEPEVAAALIDQIPGRQRYAVASEGNFHITTKSVDGGVIGKIRVDVLKSGRIGGSTFGEDAQMPGPTYICSQVNSGEYSIYQSFQKTALTRDGDVLNRAVIVTISYDENLSPDINFKSGYANIPIAQRHACDEILA